jgi:alpha-glucosidase
MDTNWLQHSVVYQIYPRSFKDSNGDGVGDLQGIIYKLDYLNDGTAQSLGIDAIWISPFYPSPMADFGYDISDYCNVDPLFGDLSTFDRLVTEAHRRGIKVIIDYVPNHTSDQHPWFIESRSSRNNPKREWYIWRDARPDGSPPNNWGSLFGGPAWTWDQSTGQYYLHQFLKEQPELNWRNPNVRQAMLDVLHFWLRRGVDGFRMDVIAFLLKDPEFRDNPLNPNANPSLHHDDLYTRQLHVYNEDLDEMSDVIREIRSVLDQYEARIGIGEVWYELDRWVRYFGANGDGLHMPFNFKLMQSQWSAAAVRDLVESLEGVLPAYGWPNYVLGNHDYSRLASRIGQDQARVAAMLLLTLRGTPTLYQGDELGLENGIIPADKIRDPAGIRLGVERTRDVARTPMQWDASLHAGFSNSEPWLPVSEDYRTRNVAVQDDNPTSMLNLYRKLLWLRRQTPAFQTGSYRTVEQSNTNCFCYLRSQGAKEYLVTLNFTNKPQDLSLALSKRAIIALSTNLNRDGEFSLPSLHMRPNEGLLIELLKDTKV